MVAGTMSSRMTDASMRMLAATRRYHRLVLPFSAQTRTANLTRMAEDRFDVLVIGGGITGVGIALDAAARGLSVALVEKDDFAAGTSGRSSRLVHGGLRYLEHGEFGLVRESLRERGILFRLAPHLVRPVSMYMLADDLRSRATYRVGLTGYELLAAGRNIGYHRSVSAGQVRAAIPGLGARPRGFRYFECQVDDARLTIEVARAAQAAGARLANHARVIGLLGDGRVAGAIVADEMTGQRFEVRARAVVNAAGVWADQVTRLAGAGLAGAGRRSWAGRSWAGRSWAGRSWRRAAAAEQGRAPGVRPGCGPDHGGAGRAVGSGRRAVHLHRPVGGPGVRRDDRQPLYGRPGSPGGRRRRP